MSSLLVFTSTQIYLARMFWIKRNEPGNNAELTSIES